MDERFLIDPDIKKNIVQTLDAIETEHEVKILHAAESGSRAWGFPSPDSDYDVRFFYIHKKDWYLSIYPGRDVIERPVNKIYDVSGWDLKKAIHLAQKPNAVVMEWLQSPITYRTNDHFVESLKEFCIENFNRKALMYHYLNLGTRQVSQTWRQQDKIHVKKYFYMLRPALALKWLQHNNDSQNIPMNLQELVAQVDTAQQISEIIDTLVLQKRTMNEKDKIDPIHELDQFIEEEFRKAEEYIMELSDPPKPNIESANQFFLSWLKDES